MRKFLILIALVSVFLVGCAGNEPKVKATGLVLQPDGAPVKEARVTFEGEGVYMVKFTDEEGRYAVKLTPGIYDVRSTFKGCEEQRASYLYEKNAGDKNLTLICE